jgi:hypothetical protein
MKKKQKSKHYVGKSNPSFSWNVELAGLGLAIEKIIH